MPEGPLAARRHVAHLASRPPLAAAGSNDLVCQDIRTCKGRRQPAYREIEGVVTMTNVPNGSISGTSAPGGLDHTAGPLSPRPHGGWTAWRVVTVVIGSVLALVSLGLLGGGGTLLWAGQALRHDGYVTTGTAAYSTAGCALASQRVDLGWGLLLTGLVGDVRLRVTAASPDRPVFVGVGSADRVAAYLSGTAYATVTGSGGGGLAVHDGSGTIAPPGTAGIWAAHAAGTGTQVVRWTAQEGGWMAVAMNPDGSAGVAVRADVGVSAPGLVRVAAEVIAFGIVLGVLSAALIWVPFRLAAAAR